MTHTAVTELLARSNRLGSDRKNTNYGGGNASAKGTDLDPVTMEPVDLMWVKGSGGDLGTLTRSGLATLRLDRLRALADAYPGVDREDEMVSAFEFCAHGAWSAVPSIDTAMHGLLTAPHVDHLHPDSGIAIATAADGEELTTKVFGGRVAWVPWRRPGFQLGLDIAAIQAGHPEVLGVILGGHGITSWGATSDECERNSLWIIDTAAQYIETHGKPAPFGPRLEGYEALPDRERRAKASALAATIRGLASHDTRMVGHFSDDPRVLEFLGRAEHRRLVGLGTSCPDHFLRTKIKPMLLDLPSSATVEACVRRLHELHQSYREEYRTYYETYAEPDSPAMRSADPLVVLVPGVGMFSFGRNKQTARVAGEFYLNAINVMRGAEALSTYEPISDHEKFRIEYWDLEEAKLTRMPAPRSHDTRVALVTGGASGIGKAIATRLVEAGACVVIADLDADQAAAEAAALGGADVAVGLGIDVSNADEVARGLNDAVLAFGGVDLVVNNAGLSLSKPLLETSEADWDLQHDVMAKGSFLVSKSSTKIMIEQQMGGDIIYVASKNSIFAGPNNVAYSAAKANQAHQVRLLAVELGEHGIRVNGVNPDGVVRGSGIFAGGWGAQRAATYGVEERDLGEFYAKRTILKREVLPEHVAAAVCALTGLDLCQTTGLLVPVDSGIAAAFLR